MPIPIVPALSVTLEAKATLSYGFDVKSSTPAAGVQRYRPRVYAAVSLIGSASVTIWGVARGGVSASATGSGDLGANFDFSTTKIMASATADLALTFSLDIWADYADWGWTGFDWERLFSKNLYTTTWAAKTFTLVPEFQLATLGTPKPPAFAY